MARNFYFTEEQMKHILGEDFVSYLDKSDNGCDYPNDSIEANYSQIKPEDNGSKNPVTTDKVAGEKASTHPWLRKSFTTLYEDKKKIVLNDEGDVVPEVCPKCGSKVVVKIQGEPIYICSNKKCNKYFGTMPCTLYETAMDIDGRNFRLGRNTNQMIDKLAQNNGGDKMINNMSNEKDTPIETLYTRLRRIKEMKKNDPTRYQAINGKQLEKNIQSTIENAKRMGQSLKNTNQEIQKFNTNQKLTSQKGHRKEPSNVTYYENI